MSLLTTDLLIEIYTGEAAEGAEEAMELQWELMNPFGILSMEPSDFIKKALYSSGIGLTSTWLLGKAFGTGGLPLWTRWSTHLASMRMQASKRLVMQAAPLVAPVLIGAAVTAAAGAGAYAYEKTVNEAIRESHPGSQGTWFGPFASGFGSVV